MDCDDLREAISARLDGEDPGVDDGALDAHLTACGTCRAWADGAATLHRLVRVQAADPVPDLTDAILARATGAPDPRPAAARPRPVSSARWALVAVALTQLVLAAPDLLLGGDGSATHVARELGAFDVALAVGLVVAAWQPARAWGLLPVGAALALVLGFAAVADVLEGSATVLDESHHLLEVAGLALLWLVAREARAHGGPAPAGAPGWRTA